MNQNKVKMSNIKILLLASSMMVPAPKLVSTNTCNIFPTICTTGEIQLGVQCATDISPCSFDNFF